ncbi:FAS1 domain-containing protein SELMODRAFT_448915-like [Vigna radiata var. radiata]|uniref:FAS1 domain-containing protein SELMODRAFT_448915-like n=1 Tax=Vigna radiata var. radiata TaxID=3916 RepID=A0A1S3UKQ3_VIGRR|nr:FAS1 domain-containing protein SELMODRAFT_448915-like [Vigna radiata var. radiata]
MKKTSSLANIMFMKTLLLIVMLILSATATEIDGRNQEDLVAATREMQKANYFTFVMLINMSPPDTRLVGNVTFLMPNDRMLANMVLQEGSVSGFLLRHSIPSPLLFQVLGQFPTGTTIPTSLPNCMLRVSNNGRKNYVLNNVKLISPNICVAGSSIRCHGIDGVLSEVCTSVGNYSVPSPISPLPSAPSPARDILNNSPSFTTPDATTTTKVEPHKSGSSYCFSHHVSLAFLMLSLSF